MNWLDTETKAILQRERELPIAPPKVGEFALVLGSKGADPGRLVRAVCRVNDCSRLAAVRLLEQRLPVTINLDLTEEDATLGQFELVCCEAVSAVLRSEVAGEAGHEYLADLLKTISQSPEFQRRTIWIYGVPATEAGQRFVDQFLGVELSALSLPCRFTMPAKKARIMEHWAARVGAQVRGDPAEPHGPPDAGSPGVMPEPGT
jgi:hypothetical protein